jgi:hypothetical protein
VPTIIDNTFAYNGCFYCTRFKLVLYLRIKSGEFLNRDPAEMIETHLDGIPEVVK